MKGYTDIEQSKRLADILPIESADMYWLNRHIDLTETKYELFVVDRSDKHIDFFNSYAVAIDNNEIIPAWSLSALLAQMPCVELVSSNDGHYRAFWHEKYSKWHSNPVDACTELLNREHSAQLHSCRQCVFCDWHGQYCGAKDADMGKAYMMAQKKCNYYEPKAE